ncbi:MAG: type II toxin-antitoxin system RelE/ParE family toxin [Proteobacteria bacterium]|nr:type II toxin-antitoxin system RelE/ParE family toxin [Pseudomonadota bacterium]
MKWTIIFYSTKVEKRTLALPTSILANLIHIFEMVEEFEPSLGRPHTAPLGKGLFEIRAKGKEGISRSLFCTVTGKKVVILHTLIKKKQKIPKIDLDLARKRMKEIVKND